MPDGFWEFIIVFGIIVFLFGAVSLMFGIWLGCDGKQEIKQLKARLAAKERYIQELHREINQNKGST